MDDSVKIAIQELADDMQICAMLTKSEREVLSGYLQVVRFQKGEIVFKEGDPGDYMAVVVSGKLEAKKRTEFEGSQIVIAVLEKGAIVGELSLLDEQSRSATITALEDSEAIVLTRENVDRLVDYHPYVAIALLKTINRILSIRLRKAVDRIVAIF